MEHTLADKIYSHGQLKGAVVASNFVAMSLGRRLYDYVMPHGNEMRL